MPRFHLLYDGEDADLEANKSKLRRLFLLCEAGLLVLLSSCVAPSLLKCLFAHATIGWESKRGGGLNGALINKL